MAEKRHTSVIAVALIVALLATYGVFRTLWSIQRSSHVAMVPVVVASHDVPEGHALDGLDVRTSEWPAPSVPAGAFAVRDSVVGRVTRMAVFSGEPIVPGRLAPVGTGAGIEVKITPGKRAMAIRIDEVAGMSGLIQPNSRVDVLVSMRDEATPGGKRVAKLFMENMRVLSVGTQVYRDENGKPIRAASATLEVTPEEAERLAIAVGTGSIQLVLRGYGDPDSVKTNGATSTDVLAQLRTASPVVLAAAPDPPKPRRQAPRHEDPPPAPKPVPQIIIQPARRNPDSVTVQVYRAGKASQQKFQKDSTGTQDSSQ
jgi:pilus assembly protein CpaB